MNGRSKAQSITWKARNVTEHRPARISPDGIFTARLPGVYRITATTKGYSGTTLVRVPDGVRFNPKEQPSQITSLSSVGTSNLLSSLPSLPSRMTGPGWQERNFQRAFQLENWRGRHKATRPVPATGSNLAWPNGGDVGGGGGPVGNDNYTLSIPILDLPGVGKDVVLNLFYNSKLWTKLESVSATVYDHDNGWPAPGWSLGFGKIVVTANSGLGFEDADGTTHPFAATVKSFGCPGIGCTTEFDCHTVDGTFIDWWARFSAGFGEGVATYSDGTVVGYGAPNLRYSVPGDEGTAIYPTRITDRNGNMITIAYRQNSGPQIDSIVDTLGRTIKFFYDSSSLLTAITAPGLQGCGSSQCNSDRIVIRFQYGTLHLNYSSDSTHTVAPPNATTIKAIFSPGTSTGYWFGDSDSYSSYGMISKVSQRLGMTLVASSLNEQGTITPGKTSRDQVYNYPLFPNGTLPDTVNYTQRMDTWDGMDGPPAVTQYAVPPISSLGNNFKELDITYPDGTKLAQLRYNTQGQFNYGLMFEEITSDALGDIVRKVSTGWEEGDQQSPRVALSEVIDQLGQHTVTQYSYHKSNSPYFTATNQLGDVKPRLCTKFGVIRACLMDSALLACAGLHLDVSLSSARY